MKAKKYPNGGFVTPSWVGKGRSPEDPSSKAEMSPAEYLERLTWANAVKQLEKRGVSMIDKSRKGAEAVLRKGASEMPGKNYELAIKKAKEYDVYDLAREQAVAEFRKWQAGRKPQG